VIIVSDVHSAEAGSLRHSLGELAGRIAGARSARAGDIVLRLSGEGAGTYRLSSGQQGVQVFETADVGIQPLIEVMGDAAAVQAVIDGKVDARTQFLAGGIRVRGDLRHLSDLALELGLLKHPL
jgi:hypothetical protein